jgi:hypothetical protein
VTSVDQVREPTFDFVIDCFQLRVVSALWSRREARPQLQSSLNSDGKCFPVLGTMLVWSWPGVCVTDTKRR